MGLYVLDLETTTNIEAANKSRKELLWENDITFICATMYAPISDSKPDIKEFYGKTSAESAILNLPKGRFYTWNGAKFDMHFIYHLLRKSGYKKQGEARKNESRKKQLKKNEFSYLLANSRFISLTFRNGNGVVEIRDACLIFSCSLQKFIENTCPEYPKLVGAYDYSKYREFEEDFTGEEKEYCRHDILGFSIGLYRIKQEFEKEFGLNVLESYTAGAFAMKYAKERITNIEECFPPVSFDRDFIVGGRTFVNPAFEGKVVDNITKIDANSFYSFIMAKTKLPYGRQKKIPLNSQQLKIFLAENPDKYVFARLIRGYCKYNDMFSPMVMRGEEGMSREYPLCAGGSDGIYLDDNVLRDEKFLHEGVFMCHIFSGKVGVLDYMEKVFNLKNKFKSEGKYGLEFAVKIILTATFGKFIQREIVEKYDFLNGVIESEGVKKKLKAWHLYPPIGAAITANSRYLLCQYMNLLRGRFIYCDTDSLVFTGDVPKEIPIGFGFGQWKIEAQPEGIWNQKEEKLEKKTAKGIFFQKKTYAINIDEETKITFCGISNTAVKRLYPDGVSIEQLKTDMDKGITFDILEGNQTQNGVVLVERAKLKKYSEKT